MIKKIITTFMITSLAMIITSCNNNLTINNSIEKNTYIENNYYTETNYYIEQKNNTTKDSDISENKLNPYSKNYNIIEGINYATKWWNTSYLDYDSLNTWSVQSDVSFVSECLEAAGISIYNSEWMNLQDQYTYLINDGYATENATDSTIHIGDIVYYDFFNSSDDSMDYVTYCIGINNTGKPIIVDHNNYNICEWDDINNIRIAYVIHMTNAVGHIDVTNEYRNKIITIKSLKNDTFVSSDTDITSLNNATAIANRQSVTNFEKFLVTDNYSITNIGGTISSISFQTYDENYLSAYLSEYDVPIKNTNNNSTWEAFRIFRSDNTEYILSLINGKFVQVRDDNKLCAIGEGGWSWEAYDINF